MNKEEHDKKKKFKLKKRVKYIILVLILGICIGVLSYSLFNIYRWYKDSKHVDKVNEEIQNNVDIKEIPAEEEDNDVVQVVEPEKEVVEDKSNPYWDYIKMNLINVDLSELEKTNSDTVGWLQVNGTNINYPFVQTNNNEYYLTHSFDKTYNSAGWVFLDYRNNLDKISDIGEIDRNTILYAHARLDKVMFGTLKNILKSDWYNNSNNHIIKLSTGNKSTLWQVFSVYHVPTTSDYIQVKFDSDEEFKTWADTMQARSYYSFNTSVSEGDKVLTLSTCYGQTERMVMHAKLIKYSDI